MSEKLVEISVEVQEKLILGGLYPNVLRNSHKILRNFIENSCSQVFFYGEQSPSFEALEQNSKIVRKLLKRFFASKQFLGCEFLICFGLKLAYFAQ